MQQLRGDLFDANISDVIARDAWEISFLVLAQSRKFSPSTKFPVLIV
jgi:hypothetical protein